MKGTRCGVPLCDRTPVAMWDTHAKKRGDGLTWSSVPVCALHLWILDGGGDLELRYRG